MSDADALTAARLRTYCAAVAIAVGVLGCLIVYAWAFHIESLKSIFPGYVAMKANTAIGLIGSGASLWLLLPPDSGTLRRYSANAFALLVALLGAATLSEYLFGLHLAIDELLFTDAAGALTTLYPGRMAPATSVGFLLLGTALMMLCSETQSGHRLAQGLALGVGLIAMLSINAYIYHATVLSPRSLYQRVALHTALGLLALSSGTFLARPRSGIVADIASEAAGGTTARRLLPAIVLVPLFLGWIRMRGQNAGFYGAEFGLALNATSTMVVFAVLVWMIARNMNRELQQKDLFLSHVSHELRAPLAAIDHFSSIIADGLAGETNPKQDAYLRIILRNAAQLQSMIEDLLQVTRTQTGKLQLALESVSIPEVVADVLNTLAGAAQDQNVTFTKLCSPDLASAHTDPIRLRQILTILCDNAIKFTPGGHVKIEVQMSTQDPGFLQVGVFDTGRGIQTDKVAHIFEDLYQVAEPSDAGRRGLGIGLHICKDLVVRLGGRIWVESQPGIGSRFFFTLPVFAPTKLDAPSSG